MPMNRWIPLALAVLVGCESPVAPDDSQNRPDAGQTPDEFDENIVVESGPCDSERIESLSRQLDEEERRAQRLVSASSVAGDAPERVIVRLRPGRRADRVLKRNRLAARAHLPRVDAFVARVSPAQRAALLADPDVEAVDADWRVRAMGDFAKASLGEYTPGLFMVQAPDVWDADRDGVFDEGAPIGTGIRVCVIDSGLDLRHPELHAAYEAGYDFLDDDDDPSDERTFEGRIELGGGHGTHVAGTIAAQPGIGGNPLKGIDPYGVVGVSPGVRLLVARALDTQGNGYGGDVIRAMEWCTDMGAHIISMSLGSNEGHVLEQRAVKKAQDAGVLVVAASGNSGAWIRGVSYPAAYPGVLAVGAVDMQGKVTRFSQKGPQVGLVAPGVGVLSSAIVGAAINPELTVDGARFDAVDVEYARSGREYTGTLLDCGRGESYTSCGEAASCDGFVAYVERGGFTFRRKVLNVMAQGARAVIIGNNDPENPGIEYTLGTPGEWVPALAVSIENAPLVREKAGTQATVRLAPADYASQTGTSMATPHVSGVAALVWSARPELTADQVKQILFDSAQNVVTAEGDEGFDEASGWGLVQAKAAIEALDSLGE